MLTLSNNKVAYFSDMRNFGTFKFTTDEELLKKKLKELGPDFLKDDVNLNLITKYKDPVIKILMDQKKIGSGLGNYLTAEILYRAKISPHRLCTDLSKTDIVNLTYEIKYMVKLAYVNNHIGYMINLETEADKIVRKNYHPDIKLKTTSEFEFQVYRQKTDPYGNKVIGEKIISGRTTYWVPAVQK
jgi:formamidopyrimidine-DNA glycosylase